MTGARSRVGLMNIHAETRVPRMLSLRLERRQPKHSLCPSRTKHLLERYWPNTPVTSKKRKKKKKMLLNKTATSKDQTSILSKESQRRTSLSFLRFSGTFLCKGKAFDQPREIICEKLFNAKRIKGHVWQITVAFGVS